MRRMLCALAIAVAAGAASAASGAAAALPPVREGGEIAIGRTVQPDHLDPALGYAIYAVEPMFYVYTPLLTYRRVAGSGGATLIPGLAQDLPTVIDGGRTYRLRLRPGLRYSDGRPVLASDFEHAIKRVLFLGSGASGYFTGIVGADTYLAAKRPEADIAGIQTDDATGDITIQLGARDVVFPNVLALTFAAPVPGDTPFRDMTRTPAPGVGPFKFTSSLARQFVLERNDDFSLPGIARPHLDRIVTRIVPNPSRVVRDVIAGRLDAMFDPPAPALIPLLRARYRARYREDAVLGTGYTFLNVRTPPFDRRDVRRAVAHAVDDRVLARLNGGLTAPACNFLPATMPGYVRRDPCPYGDPDGPAQIATAQALVRRAGATGAAVTVWGVTEDPGPKVAAYWVGLLNRIGLRARSRTLPFDRYNELVGRQSTRAQIGVSFAWFADFPHPLNFMFLADGATIQPTNNQNPGNMDDPIITRGIARLRQQPDLARVAGRWAALDRRLVEQAYFVGLSEQKSSALYSSRIDARRCSGPRRAPQRLHEALPEVDRLAVQPRSHLIRCRRGQTISPIANVLSASATTATST
jgi:peptide/nickel transport system substrate-binding protein